MAKYSSHHYSLYCPILCWFCWILFTFSWESPKNTKHIRTQIECNNASGTRFKCIIHLKPAILSLCLYRADTSDVRLRYEEKGFEQIMGCRASVSGPADVGRPHIFMTYYQSGTILDKLLLNPVWKHVAELGTRLTREWSLMGFGSMLNPKGQEGDYEPLSHDPCIKHGDNTAINTDDNRCKSRMTTQ